MGQILIVFIVMIVFFVTLANSWLNDNEQFKADCTAKGGGGY